LGDGCRASHQPSDASTQTYAAELPVAIQKMSLLTYLKCFDIVDWATKGSALKVLVGGLLGPNLLTWNNLLENKLVKQKPKL